MAEAEGARSLVESRCNSDGTSAAGGHELAILVACLSLVRTKESDAALRESLMRPVDWTTFARALTGHELGTPIAQAMLSIAPDLLPDDIHYAFQAIADEARASSQAPEAAAKLLSEDELLVLAAKGPDGLHWKLSWPYEVAKFIQLHPSLDWHVALKRARAQGRLRILILAILLAKECFGAPVPDIVAGMHREVRHVRPIVRRLMQHWREDDSTESGFRLAFQERLRLHDRLSQRLSYGLRTLSESETSPLFAVRRMLPETKSLRAVWATSPIGLALLRRSPQETAQIKRYLAVRKAARETLARRPDNAAAWRNLGHALFGLARYRQAIAAYDKSLIFEPEHPTVWKNRSAAMQAIGADEEIYAGSARPKSAGAWLIRAGDHLRAQRFVEAIDACDRVLVLDPKNVPAMRLGIHCRLHACDWRRREEDERTVSARLKAGDFVIRTLDHRALSDSEEENRLAARLIAEEFRNTDKPLWQGERYRHDKIRVAYLSTDFRMHAVATLIVGCLEHHDRSRFETIAVSLHPADGSALRVRMESAFDRFVHAHSMSDPAVAQLLRKLEVDIAVDLNGYTGRIRSGILARRPAPVQVSYLGFAGTMDASFIDYILADRIVLPEENEAHYREKSVYLPHTYMPSDNRRRIAEETPTRAEAALPPTGFVFACMSYAHKISPEIFDVWMRVLRSVEGSVLWLRSANALAVSNLRHEAGIRGVSPDRLIFAPPVPDETDYLARLRVADLFLDTLPYNAHATAMDALWAGLPLLTCAGRSFHSRVAASLLYAAGLPELVTSSLAQYEDSARKLATDPARLASLRTRLVRNRDTNALFDTVRMTRDLEAAYAVMWERSERGEPPMSLAVPHGLSVAAKAVS